MPSHTIAILLLGLLSVSADTSAKKGWGNLMDSDGGEEYEYGGEQTVADHQASDFSEKQYESADPNDDENGYDGDYNTAETDKDMDEEEEKEESAAEETDGADEEDDSFLQTKAKKMRVKAHKKGWGNMMDSDGGAEYEYGGEQTVADHQANDFSEKQYESADPNDDENGYDR